MNSYITENQVEYVLNHLHLTIDLSFEVKSHFHFIKKNDSLPRKGVLFFLTDNELVYDDIFWIDDLPVLFPITRKKHFYSIKDECLIFHHDIIKACFFLLSAYQEWNHNNKDQFNRFQYSGSVQERLGIVLKPVVNYYFEVIGTALQEFFGDEKIKRKKMPGNFLFSLSHDIDNVDFHTIGRLFYKIKELVGLVKTEYSLKINIKHFLITLLELLRFNTKRNPSWSFQYLRSVEKQLNIKSTFFFLQKEEKVYNAYKFKEKRIENLLQSLDEEGCEIALHGTEQSVAIFNSLKSILQDLSKESPQNVFGVRQHYLLYKLPDTAKLHEKAGLLYDSTLSFAQHEGFRTSFCLPHKLYDFDEDREIDVWEIPLNAMDRTLFVYRGLDKEGVMASVKSMIQEVKKFNGVFSLLWHNDFFDEDKYPGIKLFYEELLSFIASEGAEGLTGEQIINEYAKILP